MSHQMPSHTGNRLRAVISGGGSGGHLFPALAIARQLKLQRPDAELLFVGAKGRMEMDKVPAQGYNIKGLWIAGMVRRASFKNLLLPLKVLVSLTQAWWLLTRFKPHVAVGTGGFASTPLLYVAARKGIPTLIQEQNFYPGLANRLLSKVVDRVCGVYEELSAHFDPQKLVITGNPVRQELADLRITPADAKANFGLAASKATFLVVGGSQGATSLNQAIEAALPQLSAGGLQGIWQTGPVFYKEKGAQYQKQYKDTLCIQPFIEDMAQAYQAADLIICRAGAITLAELAYLGKPAVLVPSPNVADDHQTKNAKVMADHGAAILVPDQHAYTRLPELIPELLNNTEQLEALSRQMKTFAKPDATRAIAREILNLLEARQRTRETDPAQQPDNSETLNSQ